MPVEFKIPNLGENIEEGDITGVFIAPGDLVEIDQSLVEMETGKATVEVPSTFSGTIKEVLIKEGEKALVDQTILTYESSKTSEPPDRPVNDVPADDEPEEGEEKGSTIEKPVSPPPDSLPPSSEPSSVPVAAAPSIRKFARELGVDISSIRGTGPGNRINLDDVKAFTKQIVQSGAGAASLAGLPMLPLPDFTAWGDVERQTMSGIRKATAEHMVRSWTTIPHVTQNNKVDITHLEELRKQWAPRAETENAKLSPTAIHVKIVASALATFPKFNASIDTANNEIILKKYIHIGVAVDTPKGLVVPVIRNANEKNILQIARELYELATRAREEKLRLDEMQGGTFTLSNLGGIGGSHFTPIINYPEVAILGVGRAIWEPVICKDEFTSRLIMPVSLSYDHRIIDGADGARFIRWLCEAMEEPLLLALEGS